MDVMEKVREILDSGRLNYKLDYSVKILKQTRECLRLTVLVASKDLELQTMLGLVDETSRSPEKLWKTMGDKDRLTAENKIVVALGTEISELKTTTDSLVGSVQEVKVRSVETECGKLKI